jgi:hypothetical protein
MQGGEEYKSSNLRHFVIIELLDEHQNENDDSLLDVVLPRWS